MSSRNQWMHSNNPASGDPDAEGLENVLRDFRASVHAWADAAYSERSIVFRPAHRVLRRSFALVLALMVALTVAVAGMHERRHQQELAREAAERQAEHQRLLQQQHAREVDELLASVDSDVSREVPAAMEPLAGLMTETR